MMNFCKGCKAVLENDELCKCDNPDIVEDIGEMTISKFNNTIGEFCAICYLKGDCPQGVTCYGFEPVFPPCVDWGEDLVEDNV